MIAATTSRRDMALRRDCAMLALLALPRFLSTKACMCARCASTRSEARPCCLSCSERVASKVS